MARPSRTRDLARRGAAALLIAALSLAIAAAEGCRGPEATPAPAEPPVIPVSRPVRREVTDFVYYTGRIDAPQSVEVRARVTGYITQMPFAEGEEVKEGDLLFEIDPRPYQAQYDAYKAQVALNEANYRLMRSEYARSRAIERRASGAISPEELEKNAAQEAQAKANVELAKANLDLAKIDVDYTRITSPINGIVSRYYLTKGNLVSQNQTLLTTVVSFDPMYAYFDMDERTVLKIRKMINEGKIRPRRETGELPVYMGLEGEEGYPHKGTVNFVNNAVNLSTGTITVRGVFANPKPEKGRRLLTPGMFVRVRLPVGDPHQALLVIERALGSDQGVPFVYVVDDKNTAQYRRVTLGSPQEDGLVAIDEGLNPDDRVVVGGLPQVRPRMVIRPEEVPMPTFAAAGDEAGPPGGPATGHGSGAPDARPQPPPPGHDQAGSKVKDKAGG